ncbi:MAG: hypothetical protein H3C27_11080 [Opitutaceae bacterium]|nr:hypothetical protein [Opitutaceae bacterium]
MIRNPFRKPPVIALIAVLIVCALAPWFRNHGYLRDLYDYGLVIAANGHLNRGELPYVDFTTPIQAGFLGLNWLVERAGGGTYDALTRGAAALIVLSALVLPLMLARRFPPGLAVLLGGAVTVTSASQHTILWHNALGVFCLAVVTWAAAVAPVWRRATWGWHALLVAGLMLGGLNKLNFHLVALVTALAWAAWAAINGRARWREAGLTMAGCLAAGLVLPLLIECAWTGASPALWWHNVVALPSEQRLGIATMVFSADFLWRPIHDYYGWIWLQPVGLTGIVATLLTAAAVWKGGSYRGWRRGLAVLGAVAAGAAGAALIATNFEIVYLGLGAWLVLLVSVWLGTGASGSGRRWLWVGMGLPALVIGLPAWDSAWQGQRSQFGYDDAPRANYRTLAEIGDDYGYYGALKMPYGYVYSLGRLMWNLPDPDPAGRRPVFWGVGLEWLERFIPARREPGQALWIHWGTSYNQTDIDKLALKFEGQKDYAWAYNTVARDNWPWPINDVLDLNYRREIIGTVLVGRRPINHDEVELTDALATIQGLGGNVSGRAFLQDRDPFTFIRGYDGNILYGSARQNAQVKLQAPVYRLRGVAVINRMDKSDPEPLSMMARVTVHGSIPEQVLWQRDLFLAAGENTARVPFEVDAGGRQILFWIIQHDRSQAGRAFAGYRELEILHAGETEGAPVLHDTMLPVTVTGEAAADSLLGQVVWRPEQIVVRGGRLTPDGVELPAGGEVWFHSANMSGEVRGWVESAPGSGASRTVRTLWCKGGRVQPLQAGGVALGRNLDFHLWTGELGGWFGIVVEPGQSDAWVRVRIESAAISQ